VSYRTILVYLNDSRKARKLVHHAAAIARAFEARLIGLHVSSPMFELPPKLEGLRFSSDEEADHLRHIFEDVTHKERVSGEFRHLAAHPYSPIEIVVPRTFAADLVIASQANRDWKLTPVDFPEQLIIASGRPVLIVPDSGESPALPQSAIIAWHQQREATRALYDALPLLKGARTVEILIVEEPEGRASLNDATDRRILHPTELIAALTEHGVKPVVAILRSSDATVGEQICARAQEQRADLVVMGAYGHSRLREFILGGATKHVLSNMPVPTLFSH
jgi:nucleotide-binding universal stress UspA family protein